MTGKVNIKGKKAMTALPFLAVFFMVAVVMLFVMSFANAAVARTDMMPGDSQTIAGEVDSIDSLHHIGVMTLRSGEIGQYPNNELNVFVKPDTKVQVCDKSRPFNYLSVSRNATVTYHELGGVPVADSISEQC